MDNRFVILPRMALEALRDYWASHRNSVWLFPRGRGSAERAKATALYTQLSSYSQTDTDRRINGLLSRLRVLWGA